MKLKGIIPLALSLVVLAAFAGYGQTKDGNKKVQNVKLTVGDNGGYVVTPPNLTRGVPVRMTVDLQSVKGCARTVVISAFNVKKTVRQDDAII